MSTDGPPNEPLNEPVNEPPTAPMSPEPPSGALPGAGDVPPPPPGFAAPPPSAPPPPIGAPGPTPVRPPAPPPRPGQFILGLGLGAIPLILALIGLGSFYNASNPLFGNLLIAGAIGFGVGLVIAIVLIVIQATRRVGVGMLTALLASPIIFFIGCLVALSRPFA